MNGKKTHIRRKDFLVFAEKSGMTRGSAEKMIAMLVSKKEKLLAMCQNSLLPEALQEALAILIEERQVSWGARLCNSRSPEHSTPRLPACR